MPYNFCQFVDFLNNDLFSYYVDAQIKGMSQTQFFKTQMCVTDNFIYGFRVFALAIVLGILIGFFFGIFQLITSKK